MPLADASDRRAQGRAVRVVLADDHVLVRAGIRTLLERAGHEVVAEAQDGQEAVRQAIKLQPQLALLDVAMPRLNGIEAARQIRQLAPRVQVLMLSVHAERQYIYEAIRAGASGYVLKDASVRDLLSAIETVLGGGTYLSPGAAELALDDYLRRAKSGSPTSELEKLSTREREVLQLIAEGRSSAEIGRLLHISARTVDTHRHNMMAKLEIRSIAGLTKFAIRHGISRLE